MPATWRDNASGIYYANFRVPTDLVAAVGKSIIRKSLRTKERSVAERKNCELWLEYQRQFDLLRRSQTHPAPLSEANVLHLVEEWLHSTLRQDEEARFKGAFADMLQGGNAYGYSVLLDQLAEGYNSSKHPDFLLREAAWFLNAQRVSYDSKSFVFAKFLDALSIAYARQLNALSARDEGQKIQTPPAPAMPSPVIPLSRIISAYLADRPKDKATALKKSHACLPKLLEIVGDKAIQDLKQQDLMDFFEVAQRLPSQRGGKKKPEGMTLRQWAGAEITMAPATFENNYVAPVRSFLVWAKGTYHDQGFPLGLNTDVVHYSGTRVEGEDKQRSFRRDELERLFLGAEMQCFASDPDRPGRYWLPLLGLLTGARINELCQINPSVDWIEEDGIQCLSITTQTEAGEDVTKSIKTGTPRVVPIHPKLIELGFLDYLESVKRGGAGRLFPEFPPKMGRAGDRAREWFASLITAIGLRDETPFAKITGFHAFRHTLITFAANHRDSSMEAAIDMITGHVAKGTSVKRGYISWRDLKKAYRTVCKVDFGLEFIRPVRLETLD